MHSISFASQVLSGLFFTSSGLIYDGRGEPQGYVRGSRPERVDLYDSHSRRLDCERHAADGQIKVFDVRSRRLLTIQPPRPGTRL